jgi:transposase
MATRAEWEKRVERWNKSGKSADEFAAREGLRAKQLLWWRWKLRAESATPKDAAPLSFLPVEVVKPKPVESKPVESKPMDPKPVDPKAGLALFSPLMEIVLPNGRVVRVGPGFDLAALAHVLTIAEQGESC